MDLPDGFEFRAPTHDDLDAVADVLLADQTADGVEPTIDAHFLRQVWSRSDFALATDAWVVTDGAGASSRMGRSDGTSRTSSAPGESSIPSTGGMASARRCSIGSKRGLLTSLPGSRRRGFATRSMVRIEQRQRWPATEAYDPSAISGTCRSTSKERSSQGRRPMESISRRSTPPDDLQAIHGILEAAFADDPLHHPSRSIGGLEEHTSSPSYDPTLWLLARDGGVPVGALTASAGDDVGWVDYLAVLGSHRGRGVGSALLRRAFATFADRGLRRVRLNVDAENVTGATGVYERVGMRVVNRWDLWERQG